MLPPECSELRASRPMLFMPGAWMGIIEVIQGALGIYRDSIRVALDMV